MTFGDLYTQREAKRGKHEEYLRRNLMLAKAIGAQAAARVALERLGKMKRPPKWIVEAFAAVKVRMDPLPKELAAYRALAADAPDYASGVPRIQGEPLAEPLSGTEGAKAAYTFAAKLRTPKP